MSEEPPALYIVDSSIAVTGAFIALRNSAKLLKNSLRVVLVLPEGSSIPQAMLMDFWRVDRVPMVSLSKNAHSLLHYVPSLITTARSLRKSMKRDGVTRLQLNDFYLMHGVVLRLMGFRGQIVSWVRCHPQRFAGPLARPMIWLMARSADRVIAVSNAIRALLPADAAVEVVYDGYEGRTRAAKTWQATDEKRFVYVGNYILGKGQDIALDAFAAVAANDATVTLAFYGGDMGLGKNKAYRARLEEMAAQHGLQGRVNFHDFEADTFAVLEPAYAALNCSSAESFSMTVLEASGAGVPVIATASGGPQEIVKDGVSGYLIPVGDVAAAAARMLLLAKQPEKAAAMGEAGAKRVQAEFSMQRLRAQLLHLWKLSA
jgi:glycosyltransferase involved in cell wall biosynthesis